MIKKLAIISIITALVGCSNIQTYDLFKLGVNPELDTLNSCDIFYRGWLLAISCSRNDAFGMVENGQLLVADIQSIMQKMEPNYYITN